MNYSLRDSEDVANLAFTEGKTHRAISRPPEDYLPAMVKERGTAIFDAQCIPLAADRLAIKYYPLFLAERRKQIAIRLNAFLQLQLQLQLPGTSPIFISHATKDGSDIAHKLVAALEAAGRRCWIGPRDVQAGVAYPDDIVSAIHRSSALVLILTPGANESQHVQSELNCATDEGKLIVPLIVGGTEPSGGMKYLLGLIHCIHWTVAEAAVAQLEEVFASKGRAGRT